MNTAARFQVVTITRTLGDTPGQHIAGVAYHLTAFDLFGKILGRRTISQGSPSRRRAWALEQARQWAARHYLAIDAGGYDY